MRLYGIIQDSIVDGPGLRFVVFTQGCHHNCPGCHNPDSHDPRGGYDVPLDHIAAQMLANPLTDGLTLSGGEPFNQALDCLTLARVAKWNGLNVWAYTGYSFDYLMKKGDPIQKELLSEIDVLVDGRFVQEQRTFSLPWRGSYNQRLIDVQESLRTNTMVIVEED